MVTDQEPRYRLVDADGNVVGSLFAEADGTLKLQEGTSGNDNEVSLSTQGALEVEQADIAPNVGGSVTNIGGLGRWNIKTATGLDIANGASETLLSGHGGDGATRFYLEATSAGFGAIAIATGGKVEIELSAGGWSNTSGNADYNLFLSVGNVILENESGSAESFDILMLTNK